MVELGVGGTLKNQGFTPAAAPVVNPLALAKEAIYTPSAQWETSGFMQKMRDAEKVKPGNAVTVLQSIPGVAKSEITRTGSALTSAVRNEDHMSAQADAAAAQNRINQAAADAKADAAGREAPRRPGEIPGAREKAEADALATRNDQAMRQRAEAGASAAAKNDSDPVIGPYMQQIRAGQTTLDGAKRSIESGVNTGANAAARALDQQIREYAATHGPGVPVPQVQLLPGQTR